MVNEQQVFCFDPWEGGMKGGGHCKLNQWVYLRRKNEQALDVCKGS